MRGSGAVAAATEERRALVRSCPYPAPGAAVLQSRQRRQTGAGWSRGQRVPPCCVPQSMQSKQAKQQTDGQGNPRRGRGAVCMTLTRRHAKFPNHCCHRSLTPSSRPREPPSSRATDDTDGTDSDLARHCPDSADGCGRLPFRTGLHHPIGGDTERSGVPQTSQIRAHLHPRACM